MKYLVKRISSQNLELLEGQYPNAEIFQDILNAPDELQHPLDADILEGVDEMGMVYKYVVVNADKLAARIAAEALAQEQADAARKAERLERIAIKAAFQTIIDTINLIDVAAIDPTTIADANTKQICKDLKKCLGDLKAATKDLARYAKDMAIRSI